MNPERRQFTRSNFIAVLLAGLAFLSIYLVTPPGPLPQSEVVIFQRGTFRYISSNGIPNHHVGAFLLNDEQVLIQQQDHQFRVPLTPQSNERMLPLGNHPFGIALNGVPFDPQPHSQSQKQSHNQFHRSDKKKPIVDEACGHVHDSGAYHYHGMPVTWLKEQQKFNTALVLLGYAADGFPIYNNLGYSDPFNPRSPIRKLRSSYQKQIKTAASPAKTEENYQFVKDHGDLDEANGRFGVTAEYPNGIYYYVITENFPMIPRLFRGHPDPSFFRSQPESIRPR